MATNTPALLDAFDATIAEKISPFFLSLGARHITGESCYDAWPAATSLKPRRHEELDGRFFWWISRFVIGKTTFEIAYGDREFLIEPMLFYVGIHDRFAPWELLATAQVPKPLAMSGEAWVLTPDFVIQVITRLADGIREHWNILGKPTPEIIDRARVLRGKRMIFAQEEQRRHDRDRASIQASTAFHSGKYAEAKSLLEPFLNDADLPPSSAKIFEMAKKKLI
jgi:hypothetical protein